MLKKIIVGFLTGKYVDWRVRPSPDAIYKSKESLLFLDSRDGFGAAVLTGPTTVVTAFHLVKDKKPANYTIYKPFTGEKALVAAIRPIRELDITILKLKTPLNGIFASVTPEKITEICKDGVFIPSFFEEKTGKFQVSSFCKEPAEGIFNFNLKKGILLKASQEVFSSEIGRNVNSSIFYMKAVPGNSGSGIFNSKGNLVTILSGGKSGLPMGACTPLEEFQDFAAKNDLTK